MVGVFFFVKIQLTPRSTRTDTLFPYTTLFRSIQIKTGVAGLFSPASKGFGVIGQVRADVVLALEPSHVGLVLATLGFCVGHMAVQKCVFRLLGRINS